MLDVSGQTIYSWRRRGCPCSRKGASYEFDVAKVFAWRVAQAEATSGASLTEARRRKLLADAEMQESELAKQRGSLVDAETVVTAMSQIIGNARAKILPLGTKVAPFLVGLQNIAQIKKIIDDEIYAILTELATSTVQTGDRGDRKRILGAGALKNSV
jgi:phage terminase Nu1 subunit (DNA packaging protein)